MHDGGLDTAAHKWKQTYNIVDSRKFHSLMKQFDKLHVNPVTRPVRTRWKFHVFAPSYSWSTTRDEFVQLAVNSVHGPTTLCGQSGVVPGGLPALLPG